MLKIVKKPVVAQESVKLLGTGQDRTSHQGIPVPQGRLTNRQRKGRKLTVASTGSHVPRAAKEVCTFLVVSSILTGSTKFYSDLAQSGRADGS